MSAPWGHLTVPLPPSTASHRLIPSDIPMQRAKALACAYYDQRTSRTSQNTSIVHSDLTGGRGGPLADVVAPENVGGGNGNGVRISGKRRMVGDPKA